ncbi:MarR family transcriptional regulator [Novosphingobium sediminis]|uniref:MarR family transcriptional regulator n=1 Tax=Novosphingobium sediminis TaxID=707214 RepID=A0A512ANV6_9SPHN|nr:bifunctional helix-turn-helix transcriptional regulator/GNAT family N-acetyltransferase [Novosphingobium sediminis]GEO01392.1 MarR family transcriptional regulator [Novosphingobium sediminis]
MTDILREAGPVYLGSRLKRLAERMQAEAAISISEAGLPCQPGHMALITALARGPKSVNQLVAAIGISQPGVTRAIGQLTKLGLVDTVPGRDQRQRLVSLTPAGEEAHAAAMTDVWPRIGGAVQSLLAAVPGDFLRDLERIEDALAAQPLLARVGPARKTPLRLREYSDDLAQAFHDINAEWIQAMFVLEPVDREVLENPHEKIIAPGGTILFVETEGLGVVGTCALKPTGGGGYELTKMGVLESARGLGAGAFLLAATIARAQRIGADPLYLLTNHTCAAAIHLYEKLGFRHDAGIMAEYGTRYARCDVAMRYAP